jgi:hypothetical protein
MVLVEHIRSLKKPTFIKGSGIAGEIHSELAYSRVNSWPKITQKKGRSFPIDVQNIGNL